MKFTYKMKIKTKFMIFFCILLGILLIGLTLFFIQFDNYVIPMAIEISENYAVNVVNAQINQSVEETISSMQVISSDFIQKTSSYQNTPNYIDIDTMLINTICYNVSNILSKKLQNINDTKIELPIGIFSGVNALSNLGPTMDIKISTIGNANIDYETKFEAVGINQINFQIFLNINTNVAIVNPLYRENININRKLMLVNTIFDGQVPNTYFNANSF